MSEITATDAARKLADLLDAVEHDGQRYTITRSGKPVAHIEPVPSGRGADTKALLRRHRPDGAWSNDLNEVRELLDVDVAIAAITVAELTVGALLATARRRAGRQAHVDETVESITIIPCDESAAVRHAALLVAVRKTGRPRGAHDLMVAATASAAGRAVVSADRRAFDDLPGVVAIDHRSV